jgi:DNA-binding CsgD family transcriptional regulator
LSYLSHYFHFLITFNILAFLKLILTYLAPRLFGATSSDTFDDLHRIHTLILYFVFPLAAFCIYFFIKFAAGFFEKKLPGVLIKGYVLFWAIMCVGYALGIQFLLEEGNAKLLIIIYIITVTATIIILGSTFVKIFFFTSIRDKEKQGAIKTYGAVYVLCFMIYMLTLFYFSDPYFGSFAEFIMLFVLNFPPLFYLKRFLKKYYLNHPLEIENGPDWGSIFSKYKISNREGEIMRLLLAGKSAKDIEDELFISIKTVKNHIHHIYKKLKVKNRVQLINLINNFQENRVQY